MIKQCRQAALIGLYFLVVTSVDAAGPAVAPGTLYRYVNEQGELILSNQIPPNEVVRGYEILDKRGKVIETVSPPLTQEERDAKEAEEARKENDKKIMRLYANYDDIDRALNLVVSQIDANIVIIKENISGLIRQRETTQASAAELERKGKGSSSAISDKLFIIDKKIKSENKRLLDQEENKKKTVATFAADRLRLGELRNLPGPTKAPNTELRPLATSSNDFSATMTNTPLATPSLNP
jgi:hypothetical protein